MKRWTMAAALVLAVAPAGAQTVPKVERGNGFFFNRPGATMAQATADATRCKGIAEGAESQINGVNVLFGGVGAIIGGAIAGGRLKRINLENCMLIGGWRLFAMTDAEGKAWKALTDTARDAELASLVGAETPARGTLLREWRNDYAEPVLWKKD